MNKNIWILFDCPDGSNDKKWLLDELSSLHVGDVHSVSIHKTISRLGRQGIQGKLQAHMIMLGQAMRAVKRAQEGDIIIAWSHREGLYVNWIIKMKRKRLKLISMNWLTPSDSDRKVIKMERAIVNNPNARIIVNSPESPGKWKEFLMVPSVKMFRVIPDALNSDVPFSDVIGVRQNKYCFTGGMNNRDWKMVIDIANAMKETKFVCVALEADFKKQVHSIPENVEVYYDVPVRQYYSLMKNTFLIVLPLLDSRAAGLINITRAAQYGVPYMISGTPATKQYYATDFGDLLITGGGADEWVRQISKWLSYSEAEYVAKTEKFCRYIEERFSPHQAAQKIMELIAGFAE